MSNQVFESLFRERMDIFRAAFCSIATEVFYDAEKNVYAILANMGCTENPLFANSLDSSFLLAWISRRGFSSRQWMM